MSKRHYWRRVALLLGATIGLGVLTAGIVLGWPCDPRVPRFCTDTAPEEGARCSSTDPRCTWRKIDDDVRVSESVLCRFYTYLCPAVPSGECNLRARAVEFCTVYECAGGRFGSCGPTRFVFDMVVYFSLEQDCSGRRCGPLKGNPIWGPIDPICDPRVVPIIPPERRKNPS